jgi:hypothetical protein
VSVDSAPRVLENQDFELVGYSDLGGRPGFKLALHEQQGRWYLYVGHLWHRGWSVLDVTDPTRPELCRMVDGPQDTWTIQVQAAEGLLVTGLEKAVPGWGIDARRPFEEGAIFWDIRSDPTSPRRLGSWRTGSTGTHRNFYAGGPYAFMAAARPGYVGHGLAIVDVSDPQRPRDVSFWALPEQRDDRGQGAAGAYLHGPAHVRGTRAYLSYGSRGLVVLDVSDVNSPRLLGRLDFGALGNWLGCHSAVPVPGRDLLVVNSEAIEEGAGDPLNYAFVVDISDDTAPRVISTLPMPRPTKGLPYPNYYAKGGRFGPHNQHHHQDNPAHLAMRDHVLLTYFNAGLRLYDISDPLQPIEEGWFVPEDPAERRGPLPTTLVTQFEDVIVDARGYVYCTDKNHGLFVLRYTPGLR